MVEDNKVIGVKINDKELSKDARNAENKIIKADKVVLATGGKSYPLTGSTGDGYELAKKLGHTITAIKPSLVPLETHNKKVCQEMQGLSLRNVKFN